MYPKSTAWDRDLKQPGLAKNILSHAKNRQCLIG